MTQPIGPPVVTREWVARLASLVHELRPDWQEPGIRSALTRVADRPLIDVAAAAIAASRRTDQRTPAIIAADGTHWAKADTQRTYTEAGIVTGVDVRGVGCVYHYPSQRWNHRKPAMIPFYLKQKLLQKVQQQRLQAANIQKVLELDKEEIAMMHAELIDELDKPIADGKRNNTLFAIGSKMKQAQVPNWDVLVGDRATQVGLDDDEIDKLISNISSYA